MVKKKELNTDLLFKVGVIILLIVLVAKFKSSQNTSNLVYVTNQSIIQLLNAPNNQPGAFCELYTNMNTEFTGQSVTFTVSDGANTQCHVYGKYNNDQWGYVGLYTTGTNGKVADKITLTTPGTLYMAAVCGACVTDQAEIIVKQTEQQQIIVPPEDQALTCAQKAQQNNAYYKEPILIAKDGTANSCYGWASQDCVDKGQAMSGYGLQNTCCLYTCEAINQPVPEPELPLSSIFISSQGYRGDLGGSTGADQKCDSLANMAGLSGTWRAIISTSQQSAKIRLQVLSTPFWDTKGNKIADNAEDLFDGTLDDIIYSNELGTPVQEKVWTGTLNSGDSSALTCNDWTDATSGSTAMYGISGSLTSWWIADGIEACNLAKKLYCIKTAN